jgi:MmyB-like transcription regulator ligand binding domain
MTAYDGGSAGPPRGAEGLQETDPVLDAAVHQVQQFGALRARALHLSDEEHAHLLRMAGHAADSSRIPRIIPGSLHRIVDQLAGNPLAVYDATRQLLHWNPLFAATFGDPKARGVGDRKVLVWRFLGELPRVRQSATDFTGGLGHSVADGATSIVNLATIGQDSPTGQFVDRSGELPW